MATVSATSPIYAPESPCDFKDTIFVNNSLYLEYLSWVGSGLSELGREPG